MTTSNVQTKTKPVSKAQLAFGFYRATANDLKITKDNFANEETKPLVSKLNKMCKDHFTTTVGLTEKGCGTYIQLCKDRFLGKDPHIGRKLANKNRSAKLKQSQQAVEQPIVEEVTTKVEQQSTVDLSNRWLVGTDKDNLTGSFKSRTEAQVFAKDNNIKWFDKNKV